MAEIVKKIFISHSSDDERIIKKLVALFERIGVKEGQLFCSSAPGYDIRLGKNISSQLKKELQNEELFFILLLSPSYNNSDMCFTETRVAWGMNRNYVAILLPGSDYNDLEKYEWDKEIAFKLYDKRNRESRLTDLKDTICDFFKLDTVNNRRWEVIRNEFLLDVDAIIKEDPLFHFQGKWIELHDWTEESETKPSVSICEFAFKNGKWCFKGTHYNAPEHGGNHKKFDLEHVWESKENEAQAFSYVTFPKDIQKRNKNERTYPCYGKTWFKNDYSGEYGLTILKGHYGDLVEGDTYYTRWVRLIRYDENYRKFLNSKLQEKRKNSEANVTMIVELKDGQKIAKQVITFLDEIKKEMDA